MPSVVTNQISRNLPDATLDWLKPTGFIASYILLQLPIDSQTLDSADAFNPFILSNIDPDQTPDDIIQVIGSHDMIYDSSAGTVKVETAGNYFILFAPAGSSNATSGFDEVVYNILKNGSSIFETTPLRFFHNQDPEQAVCHTIVSLAAGDLITTTIDSQTSEGFLASTGTQLFMLRITGDFATARITTDYDQISSSDNLKTFDDNNYGSAGAVATNTDGVTFDADGGKFTPTSERMFYNLQTLMFDTNGTTAAIENRLTLNNSTSTNGFMDIMLAGATAAITPLSHTQQIMKAIPSSLYSQPTRGMVGSDTTGFTFEKGTCFSIFDISNNGTMPLAYLNIIIRSDSSALGTSEENVYDENNYSSFSSTDPNDESNKATGSTIGGNTNITYTSTNGRFTISEPGDYLIISNLGVDTISSNGTVSHRIKKNGTTISESVFYAKDAYDPITNLLVGITPCNNGDYLEIKVQSASADIQDGTSVMIYRVGPNMGNAPGVQKFRDGATRLPGTEEPIGQPIVQNDDTIDSADKGDQRDRNVDQSPFRMSVNGPLTLRGRARSSLPFNVAAGKRGGKK